MNLADDVRRIVREDPSALERPMSKFEDYRLPLHFAVQMSRPAMIELLIKAGARTDVRNKDGLTPVELARKWGHANLVPALERVRATN